MFVLQKLYKRMSDVAPSERALKIMFGAPREDSSSNRGHDHSEPAGFVKNACTIESQAEENWAQPGQSIPIVE